MEGKWLIFWWSLSLKRSWASIWESVHITSQICDFFDLSTSQPNYLATVSTTSYCVSVVMCKSTRNIDCYGLCVNFLDFIFYESGNYSCWLSFVFFGPIVLIEIVVFGLGFLAGWRWRVWYLKQFFHVILLLI